MKIAVVILNWNGEELLRQFLPSVISYSAEADIYVADNASSDGSLELLKMQFPTVKVIANRENLGFAGGYNLALKSVDADVFALVNSDIEVTANWLQPIIEKFTSEPKTAIIQPKIRDFKNKDYFEYAGAAGGFIDKYGYPFCRGRLFDTIERDTGQYDDDREIFWASGACLFIRAKVYRELHGFDSAFFAHQEEIDLCWRAKNRGYDVKYAAKSVVYHVGGATLAKGNPQKTYLNFRNSLLMLAKNLPSQGYYGVLMTRLVLDGVAGIQFLAAGKPSHVLAILKAHFHFYKMMKANSLKRTGAQTANYYAIKSVVYSYFVKRKQTFNNLF